MQKRTTAFVLIAYSAILINGVVFKGPLRVQEWGGPGREERAEGGREGRGRGGPRSVGGSESRSGRRAGPDGSPLDGTRLSTSRFAPLHANYVPFRTIWPQLRGQPRWSSAIINLVGNTVLFVPIGFLVLLLHRKMTWQQSLVLGVAVGITLEVMEGMFRVGVVDVDDVILNAIGVMSGYWLCRVSERRRLGLPPGESAVGHDLAGRHAVHLDAGALSPGEHEIRFEWRPAADVTMKTAKHFCRCECQAAFAGESF